MSRLLPIGLVAGLAIGGCNALFGIEEGVPLESAPGQAGSDMQQASPLLGSGGAVLPGAGGQGPVAPATTEPPGSNTEATEPMMTAAVGGSGGSPPADAGTEDRAALPAGVTLVDEALVFTGATFQHSLGLAGNLSTTKAATRAAIEPDCVQDSSCFAETSGGTFCVRGSVDAVVDNDFVSSWGLNIQLNLAGARWDRSVGRIKGISFELSGSVLPQMRFHATRPPTATESFDNYCQEFQPVDGQRVDVLFDELKVACWDPAAENALPPDAVVATLAWQINAVTEAAKPFDFCVRLLRPLIASE